MIAATFFLPLLAASSSPGALQVVSGKPLWRDLTVGTTKAEFKRRYPKYRGMIGPDCPLQVTARFKDGGLVTVWLLQNSQKRPDCLEFVKASLFQEYGQPKPIQITSSGSYGNRIWSRTSNDLKWQKDGVSIIFAHVSGGYNLIYSVVPLPFER